MKIETIYRCFIQALILSNKRLSKLKIPTKLLTYVNQKCTKLVDPKYSCWQKLHWFYYNLQDFPLCRCEKCSIILSDPKYFLGLKIGYRQFCSNKCAQSSIETKKKQGKTLIENFSKNNLIPNFQTYDEELLFWIKTYDDKMLQICLYKTYLYDYVMNCTTFMNDSYTFSMRIYATLFKFKEKYNGFPICQHEACTNLVTNLKHSDFRLTYDISTNFIVDTWPKFCSSKCSANAKSTIDKREKSCLLNLGVKHNFESSKVIEDRKHTWIKNYGVDNPSKSHDIVVKKQQKYYYQNQYFSSSPELAYYIWLTDNQIKFEYQPKVKITYTCNGKTHRYFPDFLLTDTKQLVEIKGDQFFDKNGQPIKYGKFPWFEKYQCMLENNVKILLSSDYQKYIDYVYEKYGKNYLKSFRSESKKIKSSIV